MAKPSKQIMDFMEKFGVESDEVWQVPDGAYVVKHAALERVAAEQGIKFDPPAVASRDYEQGGVAMCVTGHWKDRTEWSFGEASPLNLTRKSEKRPLYPWAMSEKRAKDRVILKLLKMHGALYSEEEADEFKRPNPHTTKPTDVFDPIERDGNGQPVDNIPHVEPGPKLTVAQQRPIFADLQKEAQATTTSAQLLTWMNDNGTLDRIASLKSDWQEFMRGVCADHLKALRTQERGDAQRAPNMLMAG